MRFRRKFGLALRAAALAAAALGLGAGFALAQNTAVIPKQVIYPGEIISSEQVDVVCLQVLQLTGNIWEKAGTGEKRR